MLKQKRYIKILVVVVLIIVARLPLPYFLKKYVKQTLDEIPGYYGQVEDVDVALIRGAYVIEGLTLHKKTLIVLCLSLIFPKQIFQLNGGLFSKEGS